MIRMLSENTATWSPVTSIGRTQLQAVPTAAGRVAQAAQSSIVAKVASNLIALLAVLSVGFYLLERGVAALLLGWRPSLRAPLGSEPPRASSGRMGAIPTQN